MTLLPKPPPSTVRAIFERHEKDAEDWRRPHLGASQIGNPCHRALWYSFRWASPPDFSTKNLAGDRGGRMLRLFERGQREEVWIIEELRAIGVEVHCSYSEDGEEIQYRFEHLGGHFGGSVDGVVRGIKEAVLLWFLLEVKTAKDSSWKKTQKIGVQAANPVHYAQMQVYMRAIELNQAFYVCVNKNDDHIYTEIIYYDPKAAESEFTKAEKVIAAKEPLAKISDNPAWFECKLCDYRPHCQVGQLETLERNCRTCVSSTPLPNGKWVCELADIHVELSIEDQRRGCASHIFIPKMLPWEPVDWDEKRRILKYKTREGLQVIDAGRELTEGPWCDEP